MVRVVAELYQLHAKIHYLVLHDVHSNPFLFCVTAHTVLAGDVARDGIALGEPVLTVQEIGQLQRKGQAK